MCEFKIWKELMPALKQTIPQKKALVFSFKMAPWKWLYPREVIEVKKSKKKSKTIRAAMKFNKICFLRRESVAPSW